MKTSPKIAAVAGLTLILSGCGMQQFSPVENSVVVTSSGKSQRAIFNKSRQWFSEYFVSGESVVDYESAEAGTIIGNGVAKIGSDPLGVIRYNIHYTIRIDTKDGRFKVTTKVVKHTNTDSRSTYDVNHVTPGRNDLAAKHLAGVVESVKQYVNGGGGGSSNW
jgi:hypothetical protein